MALDRDCKSRVARTEPKVIEWSLKVVDVSEYGVADGLANVKAVNGGRSVVADSRGRIWFSTSHGLSVVDPSHIMNNSAPALPHVEHYGG